MRDHQPKSQQQLPLFASGGLMHGEGPAQFAKRKHALKRKVVINPHLAAARRIAKKMRRLPDRSEAETRAGLAICAQLKAYLADGQDVVLADDRSTRPEAH